MHAMCHTAKSIGDFLEMKRIKVCISLGIHGNLSDKKICKEDNKLEVVLNILKKCI